MAGTRRKPSSAIQAGSSTKRSKNSIDLGFRNEEEEDDEIDSEDDFFQRQEESSDDDEEEETLQAKKVRLARDYLHKLEQDGSSSSSGSGSEDEDDSGDDQDMDRVGRSLQKQRLKRQGVYERMVADKLAKAIESIKLELVDQRLLERQKKKKQQQSTKLSAREQAQEWVAQGHVKLLKGHDLTATCISLQADGSKAVSGSKDHSVILWDMEQETALTTLSPHWKKDKDTTTGGTRTNGQVLSVACSDDGRYAAVGRHDATVSIFDIRSKDLVKTFTGHKSAITCLAFQTQSLQLFSGSDDRCVRHYNLEDMMYLETLYGHQFGVTGIDCHVKERPISVGRDRTARAWKLQEDTHLIFRGGAKLAPADCVSVIKDDWFLSGHENGQLCLWLTDKKKAIETVELAHGSSNAIGNGIGSICALKGSDVVATGANDGFLRFWKANTGATLEERGLETLAHVPVHGFINGIDIGPKARFCVVALGQEPRLGRWNRVANAKNRIGIVKLSGIQDQEAEEVDADEDSNAEEEDNN
ncbi:snoRNP-associated protein-like EMB2271 [Seminavis robusta]|uniref:snoRNP-associated protein-like EMB2271 n=1 Tax=Seminavis robusta TaxID=568900 RepID=A0A9N8DY40_9STRA|nr:snoRNP-associated protein-like EMB2271 [Seminavis robusta]|eukprot:Sro382_g131180.1 snoRNP-associated protein-like EMB2271 (529) ;mRNA; f:64116-65790